MLNSQFSQEHYWVFKNCSPSDLASLVAVTPDRASTLREVLLCFEYCDINVGSQEKPFYFLKLFINVEAVEEIRKWLRAGR